MEEVPKSSGWGPTALEHFVYETSQFAMAIFITGKILSHLCHEQLHLQEHLTCA